MFGKEIPNNYVYYPENIDNELSENFAPKIIRLKAQFWRRTQITK